MALHDEILREIKAGNIPHRFRASDLKFRPIPNSTKYRVGDNDYANNALNVIPRGLSVKPDGSEPGDYVKKGQNPAYHWYGDGEFELIVTLSHECDAEGPDDNESESATLVHFSPPPPSPPSTAIVALPGDDDSERPIEQRQPPKELRTGEKKLLATIDTYLKNILRIYHGHAKQTLTINDLYDLRNGRTRHHMDSSTRNDLLSKIDKYMALSKRCTEVSVEDSDWSATNRPALSAIPQRSVMDCSELMKWAGTYNFNKYPFGIYKDLVIDGKPHNRRFELMGAWKTGCLRLAENGNAYTDSANAQYSFTRKWASHTRAGYDIWRLLDQKSPCDGFPDILPLKVPAGISELSSRAKFGFIWAIFSAHVCKPEIYPLYDQHVWRAYKLINTKGQCAPNTAPSDWSSYLEYVRFFRALIDNCKMEYWRADQGLWVFGKYSKTRAKKKTVVRNQKTC